MEELKHIESEEDILQLLNMRWRYQRSARTSSSPAQGTPFHSRMAPEEGPEVEGFELKPRGL